MSTYAQDALDALADIREAGATVTFRIAAPGTMYVPATDTWSGTPAPAAVAGSAVEIEGDPDRLRALGLVLANPVTLLVAASGLAVVPKPGMTMTWAGGSYTVRDVTSVAPNGTAITYTVTGSL